MFEARWKSSRATSPLTPLEFAPTLEPLADSPKCVLIVDDDADVREALELLVRTAGNGSKPRTWKAQSGEEALALLCSQFFDLVVSDYRMGRMTGVALLERARGIEPDLPFILVTGDPDKAQKEVQGIGEKNVAILAKPVDSAAFMGLVFDALGWADGQDPR